MIADRCRRATAILTGYAADARAIETGLSEESGRNSRDLLDGSKSAAAAAALAAAAVQE